MTSGRIQQLYNGDGSSGSGTASAREHDATSTGENHYVDEDNVYKDFDYDEL